MFLPFSSSWTRNSRRIVTSSSDWSVHVYDVVAGELIHQFEFDAPIISVALNPTDEYELLFSRSLSLSLSLSLHILFLCL
jgi:hypothetical protein